MSGSVKEWLHQQAHHYHILLAIESVFAVLLSYYLADLFSSMTHFPATKIAGLWGAISSAIVITSVRELSLNAGWCRFLGSLIGVVVSAVFAYMFGYGMLAFGFSVFLTVVVCYALPWQSSYHGALITVSVVIIVGQLLPSAVPIWFNAGSRLTESTIGILVTLAVIFVFQPLRKFLNLTADSRHT